MQILKSFFVNNIKCISSIFTLVSIIIFGIIYYQFNIEKISYYSNIAQRISFVNYMSQNDIDRIRHTYDFLMLRDIELVGATEDLSSLQDIDKFIICYSWDKDKKEYLFNIYNNPKFLEHQSRYPNYLKSLENIDTFCKTNF